LSSARVSSAVHGLPRPDSHRELLVQGQVGLLVSPRGCPRPAAIRTRTPSPRKRCACRLRHGADCRQNGNEAAGRWRRPHIGRQNIHGVSDPVQRFMAALPSSSVANRCWTTNRPTGFRDAVCIMGVQT